MTLPPLPKGRLLSATEIGHNDEAMLAYGAACAAAERDELAAKHYAAPQQRQPLTDEQIDRLDTQAIHGGPDSQYAFRFARLIERAILGEAP